MQTTRFSAGSPLDSTIETLIASHDERSKDDPNFRYQVERIQAGKRIREQKTVSLNIEERRAARERELSDALQRENERRVALQLEPLESLGDIDDDERPDVQLDQAAKIVTDMARMREVNAVPAQTAQVSSK